jgi:hypothetical protein
VGLWYCENVKNLTVSIPDEIYLEARVRAAEEGSSVSSLVASYLHSLGKREVEFSRLEAQQGDVLSEIENFRAGDRLSRNELHQRAVR